VQAVLAHSLFALSVDCFHQSLAHTPRHRTVISGMRIERNGIRRREEEQLTAAAYELGAMPWPLAAYRSMEQPAGWCELVSSLSAAAYDMGANDSGAAESEAATAAVAASALDLRGCLGGFTAATAACGMRATQPPHQSQ
jgi:hypothetical protein